MLAQMLVLGVFPALMAYAAASDLLTMTIANWISLALVAGFFAVALLVGMPIAEIGLHLAAGLVVLAVTFSMFAAGWIGGGDAKLAAATALWLGFGQLADYLLIAAILGGALTLALLMVRRYALPLTLAKQEWAARLHAPTTGIPYGIALAAAALLVYPHGAVMHALAG
ncbi:A24 family peptidase [Ancylobacter terrae]|uniref:A24 family peptidase n=1 Tax=Ancylobacter sp. sgz301288 TaxID=3342077 RepID=UPI00385EA335